MIEITFDVQRVIQLFKNVVPALLLRIKWTVDYGAVLPCRFSFAVQSTAFLSTVSHIRPRAKAMVLLVFKQLQLLLPSSTIRPLFWIPLPLVWSVLSDSKQLLLNN